MAAVRIGLIRGMIKAMSDKLNVQGFVTVPHADDMIRSHLRCKTSIHGPSFQPAQLTSVGWMA